MVKRKLTPQEKAIRTAKWAVTMTRQLITRSSKRRWQIVSFVGPKGCESRGIVDAIAMRKDFKHYPETLNRGDRFELVLIQVKGGTARNPSENDKKRMLEVAKHYDAKCCILSRWKKGELQSLSKLDGSSLEWKEIEPEQVFK